MGRASWGAQSDLSGTLAFLYNQQLGEERVGAERAARRAEEEQAAADQAAIEKWQDGAMSDEEFRDYAAQRVADTTAGSDRDLQTFWEDTQRDFETKVLSEVISLEVDRLVDEIEEGRATWGQLKTYLTSQKAALSESSPLYDELTKQIGQVTDQVRQSRIAGEFEQISYLFESDKITGKEAGRRMRALGDKYYKTNDPETYYKVLRQANELEQFGGLFSSSGSRRGGGGGGGGGGGASYDTDSLRTFKGLLEGQNAALKSVLDQANNGQSAPPYAFTDENGNIVSGNWQVLKADGTEFIPGYQNLQTSTLANYDQQIQIANDLCRLTGNGSDCNSVGQLIADRGRVIGEFQTFNTTQQQNHGAMLSDTLTQALDFVTRSDDPAAAWRHVEAIGEQITNWQRRVEADTISTPVDTIKWKDEDGKEHTFDPNTLPPDLVRDNPELQKLKTTPSLREKSPEDQVNADFLNQARAMGEAARLLTGDTVLTPDEIARVQALLGPFMQPAEISNFINMADMATDIRNAAVTGDGSWVQMLLPDPATGSPQVVWQPTSTRPVAGMGGESVDQVSIVTPNGDVIPVDTLQPIALDIAGKPQQVYGLPTSVFYKDGIPYSADAAQRLISAGEAETTDFQNFQTLEIPGANGQTSLWLQESTTGQWHRGKVRPGVVYPYEKTYTSGYRDKNGVWHAGTGQGRGSSTTKGQFDSNDQRIVTPGSRIVGGNVGGVPIPYSGNRPMEMEKWAVANLPGYEPGQYYDFTAAANVAKYQLGTRQREAGDATIDWYADKERRDRTALLDQRRRALLAGTQGTVAAARDAVDPTIERLTNAARGMGLTAPVVGDAGGRGKGIPAHPLPNITPPKGAGTLPKTTIPKPPALSTSTKAREGGTTASLPKIGGTLPKPPAPKIGMTLPKPGRGVSRY
jgi:hypothetical protein